MKLVGKVGNVNIRNNEYFRGSYLLKSFASGFDRTRLYSNENSNLL